MNQVFSPKAEIFRWGPNLMSLFYMSDFNYCLFTEFPKKYPAYSWPKTLVLKKGKIMVWLNDFSELRKHGGKLFLERMLPTDKREESRAAWKKDRQVLVDFERKIDKLDLKSLSDAEFMALWHDLHQVIRGFWVHCILPELSNYGSSEILRERLRKYIKDETELNSAMEALTAPLGMSFYQEEEIDLDETEDLKEHQKKYFWLKNSYGGVQVLGLNFFAERKKNLEKGVRKQVAELLKNAARKKEEIKQRYSLPKDIMAIADAIVDGIVWQDARKKDIWIYLHYQDLLLNELTRRYSLPKESLLNFGSMEIEALVKEKNISETLKSRDKSFGVLFDSDTKIIDGITAQKYWDMYAEEKAVGETSEIRGIIASKGIKAVVRGPVKIILDPHNAKNFNEGDVLVTTMTTPDFIFVMKKSSAIVTDTGGLTSHAAIVSRELKKPCIIGTKIATKVLKDGDMVEVDAEKGVVRKIK